VTRSCGAPAPEELRERYGADVEAEDGQQFVAGPKPIRIIRLLWPPIRDIWPISWPLSPLSERETASSAGNLGRSEPAAGLYFKRENGARWWMPSPAGVSVRPDTGIFGATEKTEGNDPRTGPRVSKPRPRSRRRRFITLLIGGRLFASRLTRWEAAILNTASSEWVRASSSASLRTPAQAGKFQAKYLIGRLSGYDARARIERG